MKIEKVANEKQGTWPYEIYASGFAARMLIIIILPPCAVSVALKFHCKRIQFTRKTPQRWYDTFIDYHPHVILTHAVLKDLVHGLKLGRLLNLPKDRCFNIDCMKAFIVSKRCIRPFKHLE